MNVMDTIHQRRDSSSRRTAVVTARRTGRQGTTPVGPAVSGSNAEVVAARGPDALGDGLQVLADRARRSSVTPVLIDILIDPTQPEVARQRAFGRIAAELDRAERRTTSTLHTAA